MGFGLLIALFAGFGALVRMSPRTPADSPMLRTIMEKHAPPVVVKPFKLSDLTRKNQPPAIRLPERGTTPPLPARPRFPSEPRKQR